MRALVIAAMLCLAMAAGSGPAAAADRTAALDALIKASKAEGGTLIAHAIIDDVRARKEVVAAMKKMYGVDVKWEYVDFPNQNRFAARLMKEAKAGRQPSTDVFNGTQSTIPRLLKANMLAEVKNWRDIYPRLPADVIVPGGGAIPEHTRIGGFAYNTRLVPKDKVPQKLEDLLDPFWKGKLAGTPYAAVWDRASVGEQGTFDEEKAKRIRGLLSAFQTFFRQHSEHWVERFDYREAGPQLLLQAFLQRIVNGGGRIEREYGLGRMRTDLLVIWPSTGDAGETRSVIECKVLHGSLERTIHEGVALTNAVFYSNEIMGSNLGLWQKAGVKAVEMECAALFVMIRTP